MGFVLVNLFRFSGHAARAFGGLLASAPCPRSALGRVGTGDRPYGVGVDRQNPWLAVAIAMASASLLSSAPAGAAVSGCSKGSTSGSFLASDITPSFVCYIGDKSYSNFKDFKHIEPSVFFQVSQGGLNDMTHTLRVTAGGSGYFAPSESYKITYDASVWSGGNVLKGYATSVNPNDLSADWIKQLKSVAPKEESLTINTPDTASSTATFSTKVTSATFISELTVNAGDSGVKQWTDTLYQQFPISTPVPAPLPLLGAGVGWGMARRLRRRIRGQG